MLALRRLRCLPHSAPACQTRLLRTKPRPTPRFLGKWDPTLHDPRRLTEAVPAAASPRETTESYKQAPLPAPTIPQESSATSKRNDSSMHGVSYDNFEANFDFLGDRKERNESGTTELIVIDCSSRSREARGRLIRLQNLLNLANANNASTSILRAPIWRAYKACSRSVQTLSASLSRKAWDVLWKSQYMDFSNMRRREVRLAELYGDLVKRRGFGFELDFAGQVAYRLERKYMAGHEREAVESWKDNRHHYLEAPEFLDTGARLYALEGSPDQAREIMDRLLELEPAWHVSVRLVVFRAYTSSQEKHHLEKARQMYQSMKTEIGGYGSAEMLGDNSSIEMYDNCLLGFLEAHSLPDARQVFRDMAEAGHLDYTGSRLQIERVLRRIHRLYALATSVSSMSAVALDAIAVLPVAYHSHLFSDWMMYSYTQNSPQMVAQILDMMVDRGYQPEPGHFEFLLRALFRTKEPDNVLKAENLGWKMVEEVRLSSTLVGGSVPNSRVSAIKKKLKTVSVLDPDSPIQAPAANVETFALLMSHHAKRLQWEHVDFLSRQLREANIAPNCTIMNVLINNKIRQGQYEEAWRIYKTLTGDEAHDGSVFPNGETMRCLWKILQLAYITQAKTGRENLDLPTPRELLRETREWWELVRYRPDAQRFRRGLIGLSKNEAHRLLLHCFSQAHDLAGALVAFHVLHIEWNVYPVPEDVIRLCKQIAWVAMHDETESARRQFSLGNNNARNMWRLTSTYERIRNRRLDELYAYGRAQFPMTEAEAGDIELNAISEFVRIIMLGNRHPEDVELSIQAARQAIGLPSNMPTGDASAFDLAEDIW